ncbi:AbrB/MazE/SpoVT family DNA-binding domain-containing protein [Deinococcus sp.]|uniref:AbrB/MazE/SpoVT family DNA-binding domain-containing protein n=1 Tax=Deinococcus sp. TaxID=47478 RepID=UPI0025E3771E|nr:AbrB/MazE/SpoVT family DNA-binding domain-containing protein [Deinococcus sp.]
MTTPIRGTLSSKGQVTIPARLLRELRLKPGDKVTFEVEGAGLRVLPSRPDILSTIDQFAYHDPTMPDAVAHVRRERGWDEE